MIILGIDPSIAATGIAVVIDGEVFAHEVVKTKPEDPPMHRIAAITDKVMYWATGKDALSVRAVAIEDYQFGIRDQHGLYQAGELVGVMQFRLWDAGKPVIKFPVKTWRKAVLGDGGLQKDDVKLEMFKRFKLEGIPIDALEAIAVAMCGWIRLGVEPQKWTKYQLEAFTVKPKRKKKGVIA